MPRNNRNPNRGQRQKKYQARRRDSSRPESGRSQRGRQRRLSVRGELRRQPDVQKIARAVIGIALAQAEAERAAQAEAERVGLLTNTQEDGESSDEA